MKKFMLTALLAFGMVAGAQAEEALSLTPQETYEMVQAQGGEMLFIDVRDPVEIMFIGLTDAVDQNIAFQLVDRTRFNDEKQVFAMDLNENFVDEVDAAREAKGLDRDSLIGTDRKSVV